MCRACRMTWPRPKPNCTGCSKTWRGWRCRCSRSAIPNSTPAPSLEVVSRIGVGYDAVDVPALTRRKIPLMIGGTANSVSVAEAGIFLMMSLARRGAAMDRMVKEGRWHDRYKEQMPVDIYGKTVLIIGFGKIGTRSARRLRGDGMQRAGLRPVHRIPRRSAASGYEPVQRSRRGGGARRFHHDPLPEDAGDDRPVQCRAARAYEADRLSRQYRARRHHRREGALRRAEGEPHRRRRARRLRPGADPERQPAIDAPQLHRAPHIAGVTREAVERMAVVTVQNMLSVLDGKPNRDNVVNKEVLG